MQNPPVMSPDLTSKAPLTRSLCAGGAFAV